MENYTVYILQSIEFDKFYIGQTNDFEKRIHRHNSGYVSSTKPFIPWKLVYHIHKPNRSEVIILERKLKNLNRTRLLSFIKKYTSSPVSDDSD